MQEAVVKSLHKRIAFSKYSYDNRMKINTIPVIRRKRKQFYSKQLCLASQHRMQVSNMFTEYFKRSPLKFFGTLRHISFNRNESKQSISAWQITEVPDCLQICHSKSNGSTLLGMAKCILNWGRRGTTSQAQTCRGSGDFCKVTISSHL